MSIMGKFSLNAFHKANHDRQLEAFAPGHNLTALAICVQEEVGELAGAVLGFTGEKKRKAHLGRAEVLDAVADAITYLSLMVSVMGEMDLERWLALIWEWKGKEKETGFDLNEFHRMNLEHQKNQKDRFSLQMLVVRAQITVGFLAQEVIDMVTLGERSGARQAYVESVVDSVAICIANLSNVAGNVGEMDLEGLLARTFNMVSERAKSKIFIDAPESLAHVPVPVAAPSVTHESTRCIIGEVCHRHGFIHGAEAEELREHLEKCVEKDDDGEGNWASQILDKVDARDSLAYVEILKEKEKNSSEETP